ncbi:MAG: GNAT family N-acetyltransferase [Pseudomonadota bacterium]
MIAAKDRANGRGNAAEAAAATSDAAAKAFAATTHYDVGPIREEWAALAKATPSLQLSPEAFDAVLAAAPTDARFVCVRRNGRLVLLWAFTVSRVGPLSHAVRLGRAIQCYDEPLVEPGCAAEAVAAAWAEIERWSGVDCVSFSQLRQNSAAMTVPAVFDTARLAEDAPFIDLTDIVDLDAYRASLSKNRRGSLRRRMKSLKAEHTVAFTPLEDPEARAEAVRQAMAFKRVWLDAQQAVGSAYASDYFEPGFLALAQDPTCRDALKVFALTVDERTVAVEIGLVSGTTYQSHIGAFDPEMTKAGVGALLTLDVIGWCIEAGIETYDMLAPDTAFKRDWTDTAAPVCEAMIPLSAVGRVALPLMRDGRRIAKSAHAALPAPARAAAKALLARFG